MKIRNSTIRLLGLLLLIALTVQVSGLTCVAEDLSFSAYGTQADYHSNEPASDGQDTAIPGDTGDLHQCSCHLSFTRISPATITSISSVVVTVTPLRQLFTKNISTSIFQPPQIVL
ncbi:hypothetical protein MNBD_DELTA02-566 [hydrothermal vent metagenome]|uniref:Uncharacterized protein n=1 Tax=hydrothermal vent metagenome TaxID=652676 RepID=A0A3B0W255_9ZZZZ